METTATETTTIEVQYPDPEGPLHPLYMLYPRQTTPQPAYLELDPTGDQATLSCGWSGEIGRCLPVRVWDGRVLRWPVPADLSRTEIKNLLSGVAPLAEIVSAGAGHTLGYSGQRQPTWSDAASCEAARIEAICSELFDSEIGRSCLWDGDPDTGGVWDAADWWYLDPPAVAADTTDQQLNAMADDLEATAELDGVTLLNTLTRLEYLRREALERQEDKRS